MASAAPAFPDVALPPVSGIDTFLFHFTRGAPPLPPMQGKLLLDALGLGIEQTYRHLGQTRPCSRRGASISTSRSRTTGRTADRSEAGQNRPGASRYGVSGRREGVAAVVAEVDDDIGHALRLEGRERRERRTPRAAPGRRST